MDDLRKNGDGYYDPTPYETIKNINQSEFTAEKRIKGLMKVIFSACELAGFHLEERLVLKDKKTGKIWR